MKTQVELEELKQEVQRLVERGHLTRSQADQLVELTQLSDKAAALYQKLTRITEPPSYEEMEAFVRGIKVGKGMGQERILKVMEARPQFAQPAPFEQPITERKSLQSKKAETFQVITDRHLRSKEQLASYTNMAIYAKRQIEHFGAKTDVSAITTQGIEDYKYELMDGDERAPATINQYLKHLKKTLDYAVEFKHLDINPFPKSILLPVDNRRETVLTFEQVAKFLKHSTGDVQLAIRIGVYTAMRRGEIVEIRQEHIDRQALHINVPSKNTKTKKPRQIPIHPDLLPHLPKTEGKLISMTGNYISHCFQKLRQEFGLPDDCCFHTLRHTATTLLMKACKGNVAQVMKITGHKDERSLHRYTHLDYGDSRALMDQMKF